MRKNLRESLIFKQNRSIIYIRIVTTNFSIFKEKQVLKRFNIILNIIMGSSIGVFLVHFIYNYVDYKQNKFSYGIQSAPWYTSSIIYGLVTIFVITIVVIIKILIFAKSKDVNKKID